MNNPLPLAQETQSDVNLTPMLDVVFILLIFFIVTATFSREFGIQVTLPANGPVPPDTIESIVVKVEKGASFSVNGRALSPGSLAAYITSVHSENPHASLLVLVDEEAFVEDTVLAADAARSAGFDVIPIATID